MALPIHDPNRIVLMLVSWFNDILIPMVHRRYVYAGNDINSNVGEPSKSYIQGQFYIDTEYNTLYLSYILDPNIIWNNAASAPNIYSRLNEYIVSQSRNNIDTSLRKIGSFIGDNSQVGCNSVLCPGTVVYPNVFIYPLKMIKGIVKDNKEIRVERL